MLIQEKSFDGYIGVIVEFDPSNRTQWKDQECFIPADFYTVPVRKNRGRMIPRWDRKTPVPNFFRRGFYVPIEYAGTSESAAMFIREESSGLLDEVESHFCRVGQCKINPNHCPERKVS